MFKSYYLLLGYSLLVGLHSPAIAAERPNIILLFADDQRADTIAAHGNAHIQTPSLDRLVKTGFSFRRNYCAGSFSGAVCVASRAMLMTGRHWKRIDTDNPSRDWADMPLLPDLLAQQAGYRTHAVGKWHNGESTFQRAFQTGSSLYMGGMVDHTTFKVQDYDGTELSKKKPAPRFSSETFADAAIDFINRAETDEPFFLYVAFTAPHDTRNPPEAYREMYYENRPPLPKNFLPQHPFKNAPQSISGRDESLAPWPRTEEVISDQLCEYYGLITHLDEQIGRIMRSLDESPHSENTYIVYTADHGLAMGSHGLLGKQNIYEQSMSCPLIVHGPDIPAGGDSTAFTYVHDLYATVCQFADVDVPDEVDAKDLSAIWTGQAQSIRDSLYLPFQDNQRSICDGRWKLHVYPLINHQLLFDLKEDPHETNNLLEEAGHADEVARLLQLMKEWRMKLGDNDPLSVENPEPKEATYDNAARVLDVWQPKWIRDKYFDGREETNHGSK